MLSTSLHRTITVVFLAAGCWSARAEQLPFRTYTAADGLGSAFVSSIMQDRNGFMWFATRDGLSRYDGYEFVRFGLENGLSNTTITGCAEGPSGRIYAMTNGGTFVSVPLSGDSIRSLRFTPFIVRDGYRQAGVQVLATGPRGILWGGGTGAVVRDCEGTPLIIPLDTLNSPPHRVVRVSALQEDEQGRLWVGSNHGIFVVDRDRSVRHYALDVTESTDLVHALAIDRDGRLWAAHRRLGVVVLVPDAHGEFPTWPGSDQIRIRKGTTRVVRLPETPGSAIAFTTAEGLTANDATALLPDGSTIWIGTADGITRFDGRSFTGITPANGLCSKIVHSLTIDRQGGLWIGTPNGAACLPPNGFVTYQPEHPDASFNVAALGHTANGTPFAVGREWWISFFEGRKARSVQLHVPRGATSMWASQLAYHDRHGRWWALTSKGLCMFGASGLTSAPDRIFTHAEGLPSSQIFRLYEDRQGIYWVSTRTGDPQDDGIATISADLKTIRDLRHAPGYPAGRAPSAFAEDSSGALWIGLYSAGVLRWKGDRFRAFSAADGLPVGMVTDMLVDRSGRLWISSAVGGIVRIDDPSADTLRVVIYNRASGLGSENVRCLAIDDENHIVAGSVRGVDRIDIRNGSVRHFTMHDGLAGDFITAAHRDPQGTLWFGTFQGVSSMRKDTLLYSGPPAIRITGVRIGGEPVLLRDPGELVAGPFSMTHDQGDVSIDYSSIALYEKDELRYQYTMGSAKEWRSLPLRQRTVTFARLEPGDYHFRVRAVAADGRHSFHPAVVNFTVLPPFWRTWWFSVLVLATIAGVLFLLYRARVRKLQALTRLRMRLASDLHDELASNLSSIAMFSALLQEGTAERNALLERITTLATGSAEVVREIIWSIDPKVETVASLVGRLRDMVITACRARGIHLQVTIGNDNDIQHVDLSPEQRKNLWLMLKEALNNALKHSGCTELVVDVSRHGERLCLTVRDNGCGWDGTTGTTGRGSETMRMRAGLLGGTLSIEPHSPSGTCLVFLLNIQK